MTWGIALVLGLVSGAACGLAMKRVDVHPVVASDLSATASPLLGITAMLVVWYSKPGGFGSGFLAIGIGLGNLLWLVVFLGAVLALHAALGFVPEPVHIHRPVVLGALGGVCGSLSVAWLMSVATKLK